MTNLVSKFTSEGIAAVASVAGSAVTLAFGHSLGTSVQDAVVAVSGVVLSLFVGFRAHGRPSTLAAKASSQPSTQQLAKDLLEKLAQGKPAGVQ